LCPGLSHLHTRRGLEVTDSLQVSGPAARLARQLLADRSKGRTISIDEVISSISSVPISRQRRNSALSRLHKVSFIIEQKPASQASPCTGNSQRACKEKNVPNPKSSSREERRRKGEAVDEWCETERLQASTEFTSESSRDPGRATGLLGRDFRPNSK
jgi:hypothetical protein